MKKTVLWMLFALIMIALQGCSSSARTQNTDGWVSLFDGESFSGWKVAAENPETWKIQDGKLVCHGPRSHLFYVGDDRPFENFEFKADIMTTPGSNSGIYFHTRYQKEGWPKSGYEVQVNNTHKDVKRTASLYGVENVLETPAKDDQWFTMHIIVSGNRVITKVNGKTQVDFTEPQGQEAFSEKFERRLNKGTFALQGHDPQSKVYYKNIRVKRLP